MTDEATRIMSDAEMDAADRLVESRLSEGRKSEQHPEIKARVQEYMKRRYRMEVRGNPGEGYLAEAPELPGCITAGETPAEAVDMLRDAMESWIEAAIVAGDPVPLPEEERYSGRILLRMPKSLHAHLAEQARHENVSINQLATALLAEGIGRQQSGVR